ncbi:MAG: response regulator [Desulfobacteraceae bacterium]|nr:response regulator [Desulfobacteraceae bacterium]
MEQLQLVIVEDEDAHFQLIQRAIIKAYPDASIHYFQEATDCLERLDEINPDVVIADYLLPGMNGIEFLKSLNREQRDIPVIIITGQGDENLAIQAMKLGAWDYLVKSGDFFTLIPSVIGKVVREWKLKESLQGSQRRFREIFSQSPIGIAVYDQNGLLVEANKSCMDIFGVSDPVHMESFKLIDAPNAPPELKTRLLKGETVRYEAPFDFDNVSEFELFERDRSGVAFLEIVITPMEGGSGRCDSGYLVQIQDITRRKQAEEEKKEIQVQRMESIFTLAGGIAHDFNNALSGITGNIELLKMDLPNMANIDRYVAAMSSAAQRMVHLTDQLLAYARGGKYLSTNISLSEFVEETLPMIQHKIAPAICVKTNLASDISNVEADMTQMHMAFSAVVINAAEAVEGQGQIIIRTSNKEIDEGIAKYNPGLKPGRYSCLTVQDDGKGMDAETKRKIFEPFFTRKFQGRGLGMAAVYGIVKNHGGWISVESQLGKGTVVRIYLPAVEAKPKETKKPKAELARGTGTILIVEDEEQVMDVTRTILKRLGYHVLTARTGMEGVNVGRSYDGDIDLAIIDIYLPDMRGDVIYKLLMKARNNLKVIICSAYAFDDPAQKILNAGAQAFIQKPFRLATLSEKVKNVLEGE